MRTAILPTRKNLYKPMAPIDQPDVEFVVPSDNEKYRDLKIYTRYFDSEM
jgi:hypothetical protein